MGSRFPPSPRHKETCLCALLCLWLIAAAPSWAIRVDYTVSIKPKADHIHVSAVVQDDPDTTVAIAMPVWIPGYYRRLDQEKGVSNVTAAVNGKAVGLTHTTASLWSALHTPNEPVTFDYDVKRFEYGFGEGDPDWTLGQMGVYIDRDSAFIHPGVTCMYLSGHTDSPCTLTLDLPRRWESTAPLPRTSKGAYSALNYDALNDSPIQAGRFHTVAFTARGHGYEVITTGTCHVSDAALTRVCKSVAEGATDLFEGWTPFETYQFQFHFPPKREYAGAGLEHRSSCVIVFSSKSRDADFLQYGAHIVSHEFFHAWNVKAIKPAGLGPFDYDKAVETPSLWIAEGVTDYYSYVVGARTGLWSPESVLKRFRQLVAEYRSSSGRSKTSLDSSSLHVWEDGSDRSSGSGGTNYYTKGLLTGWLLDIRIRAAAGNRKSLDDAMRWLARKYAVPGIGYPPDALLTAIHEATGIDLADAYKAYVHGVEDLPLDKILRLAGVASVTRRVPSLMLGVNMERGAKEPKVMTVTKGSAADIAHIRSGDVLLKIDGEPAQIGRQPLLAGKEREIGEKVPVTVLRDGQEIAVNVIIQATETSDLVSDPEASNGEKAVWNGIWASDRFAARK